MAKPFGTIALAAIGTASGKADSRANMLRAVRAACKRLNLADDDRRAIQEDVIGKASMSNMDAQELGKLLDHLNRDYKGPMGHRAHVGKIRALWWTLYWLGAIDDPKDAPLSAFVKRQTGVDRLTFLDHRKAFSVIEALKSWSAREGVRWPDQARLAELAGPHNPGLTIARLERHAVLEAIGFKLRSQRQLRCQLAYCEKALNLGCNHWNWSERELDAAIRMIGKLWRRHLSKASVD